jgi:hypothetical protein
LDYFPEYYGQFGKEAATSSSFAVCFSFLVAFCHCSAHELGCSCCCIEINSEEYLAEIVYKRSMCYFHMFDYSMALDDLRALIQLGSKYNPAAYALIGKIFQHDGPLMFKPISNH